MQHLPHLSKNSVEDAVQSGRRAAVAHEAFATETVQLAFGKKQSGRITHITDVDRGLAAECFCPACSERLIAKQGRKKSWHFAHANGHACRDALSATLSGWLAQCLQDGKAIRLPEVLVRWGRSENIEQEGRMAIVLEAISSRAGQGGPFQIKAMDASNGKQIRILFRTARTSATPSREEMIQYGADTFFIDVYEPLSKQMRDHPDAVINADWLSNEMLDAAPRKWLWTEREQEVRATLRQNRLGKHMQALEAIKEATYSTIVPAEVDLERHGLSYLTATPPLRGERFIGPSPAGWRAALVADLMLTPFGGGMTEVMLKDAAFGRRKILSVIACRGLIKSDEIMKPLNSDDHSELLNLIPDLRRPIEIIEDYFVDLACRGALRASSRKARLYPQIPHSHIDTRIDLIKGADWIASEKISQHAMRVAKAEILLKNT